MLDLNIRIFYLKVKSLNHDTKRWFVFYMLSINGPEILEVCNPIGHFNNYDKNIRTFIGFTVLQQTEEETYR